MRRFDVRVLAALRRKLFVPQVSASDCGRAVFISVLSYYGSGISGAKAAGLLGLSASGVTLAALCDAFMSMGFESAGIRAVTCDGNVDMGVFSRIPLPCIAHMRLSSGTNHFVAVYGRFCGKGLLVMDPSSDGLKPMDVDSFEREWTGILLLAVPGTGYVKSVSGNTMAGFMKSVSAFYRRDMLEATAGSLFYTLFGAMQTLLVQKVFDSVIPGGNMNLMNVMGTAMLVFLLSTLVVGYIRSKIVFGIGAGIDIELIGTYFSRLPELPDCFFSRMRNGEILSRVNDAVKIRMFASDVMISLSSCIFMIVFSCMLMFSFHTELAVLVMMSVPLQLAVVLSFNRINRTVHRNVMESAAKLQSHMVETVSAVRTIRQFGLETIFSARTEGRLVHFMRNGYRSFLAGRRSAFLSEFISRSFSVLTLWVGSGYVVDGDMSQGELMSFYAVVSYFIAPLSSVASVDRLYAEAQVAFSRLSEVIEEDSVPEGTAVPVMNGRAPEIMLRNVCFSYKGRKTLFSGLDLEIGSGEYVVVVGASGCGKSTLLSVLQRMHVPDSGAVLFSGTDLKDVSSSFLRKTVSAVSQDTVLFSGTVLENIVTFDVDPDMERVESIVRSLGMVEFISSLPKGIRTETGEKGISMSGGQRQKIAIARALYRKPEVLLLDEATSLLDTVSESMVLGVLEDYCARGNTVISVVHRLSALSGRERIIVMKDGRIEGDGSHVSLMESCREYRRLHDSSS